jgi:uncharacterized membrane protein YphA (DoxX/SURF4 family)
MMIGSRRFSLAASVAAVFAASVAGRLCGQSQLPSQLVNGDMESSADGETFAGWTFLSSSRGKLRVDSARPYSGERSAQLDGSVGEPQGGQRFANLMQLVAAESYRGKKVRFRGAVRTAELSGGAQAQLWLRVDRRDEKGVEQIGAFDNMQARPINGGEWEHYEIVLPVAGDAIQLALGMFVSGSGKAWLDDVSLTLAAAETPTTEMDLRGTSAQTADESEEGSARPRPRFQMPPAVMQAFAKADQAPQQPFFNQWLWLAAFGLLLLAAAGLPPTEIPADELGGGAARSLLGPIPKFAVRFSVAYWLLYCLPAPLTSLIPVYGGKLAEWHQGALTLIVAWTAKTVFRIEGELVPPNGSGDTTFNYVAVFVFFVVALAVAAIWSLADRRQTDYAVVKDLLRSYLRYVLAFTMLGYGIAKVAWEQNQFPSIAEMGSYQLEKTWGDSSPMNVVWAFMGASRAYTVFAGLGEVIGGILLCFRRTATLGALVTLGVMTNVMMLNYCYDVPVKLYSTHLEWMALCIVLPAAGPLADLLIWHRPAEPLSLRPPYAQGALRRVHLIAKWAIVLVGLAYPLFVHAGDEIRYQREKATWPKYFGEFDVAEVKINGADPPNGPKWTSASIDRKAYSMSGEQKPTYVLTLSAGRTSMAVAEFSIPGKTQSAQAAEGAAESHSLEFANHESAAIPQGGATMAPLTEGGWKLSGEGRTGKIELTLKPRADVPLVLRRGYRWINEVPFNR